MIFLIPNRWCTCRGSRCDVVCWFADVCKRIGEGICLGGVELSDNFATGEEEWRPPAKLGAALVIFHEKARFFKSGAPFS